MKTRNQLNPDACGYLHDYVAPDDRCEVLRSVCLYVCLCVSPLVYTYLKNHISELREIYRRHVIGGSVSLRQQCNTLCTSGAVDDVTFSQRTYQQVNTLGEVTSQSLWSRYDRHFVGITRHNVLG